MHAQDSKRKEKKKEKRKRKTRGKRQDVLYTKMRRILSVGRGYFRCFLFSLPELFYTEMPYVDNTYKPRGRSEKQRNSMMGTMVGGAVSWEALEGNQKNSWLIVEEEEMVKGGGL